MDYTVMSRNKRQLLHLRPCTWVWLALMSLTIVVYMVGQAGYAGLSIVVLLLVSTLLKTHLVADYFMGLKQTRLLWRVIMLVYLWLVVSMIGLAYWISIT